MINHEKDPKISETLNVIKKALQDDAKESIKDDILILNKMVQEDGTISTIKHSNDTNDGNNEEISKIIDDRIEKLIDKHFSKWLDKNMPEIVNKYLKKN